MSDFGVTPLDIENMLQNFDLVQPPAVSNWVTEVIQDWAAMWVSLLAFEGITESEALGDSRLTRISALYVRLRTAAEIQRSWLEEDVPLANSRDRAADKLEKMLHNKPEALLSSHDPNTHRGGPRANVRLSEQIPGTGAGSATLTIPPRFKVE